ncbi:MAG: hypothetical protein HC828_13905 [Blastochloris sp.]|nr:hypothetical protein [Blastochloris sp.]
MLAGWVTGLGALVPFALIFFQREWRGEAYWLLFYFALFSLPVILAAGLLVFTPVYCCLSGESSFWKVSNACWLGAGSGLGIMLLLVLGTAWAAAWREGSVLKLEDLAEPMIGMMLVGAIGTGLGAAWVAARTRFYFRELEGGL